LPFKYVNRTARVGRARTRRRAVVDLQAAQMDSDTAQIADLERGGVFSDFALDTERPLRDVGIRLAELIRQDERRRAGLCKRPGP